MSATGTLTSVKHGAIVEVEAGKGKVTRYADGKPTRFEFKRKFNGVPNVQITPSLPDKNGAFRNFWFYFLPKDAGTNPIDESGFYLGMFGNPGETYEFEYLAVGIYSGGGGL
ncbi:hypothetical protein FLONG3_7174 [Fusarium longipes]|uniref:Uncharacterized protein n=1 Tax=Fusarium longipes TaxID=694270 RepID=A0A395SFI0_9HYPO|nr:hypothetical protein FLONG3_7174 [Fusarium longipes]